MKITKKQLQTLIKESVEEIIYEQSVENVHREVYGRNLDKLHGVYNEWLESEVGQPTEEQRKELFLVFLNEIHDMKLLGDGLYAWNGAYNLYFIGDVDGAHRVVKDLKFLSSAPKELSVPHDWIIDEELNVALVPKEQKQKTNWDLKQYITMLYATDFEFEDDFEEEWEFFQGYAHQLKGTLKKKDFKKIFETIKWIYETHNRKADKVWDFFHDKNGVPIITDLY
jgi:hypothetical protein